MNKQTWENLSLEEQIKWWNTNAPDETAQFKTDIYFRKYVDDKEYLFNPQHNRWGEAFSLINTLYDWKCSMSFVCEKPISESNIPTKKAEQAPYMPKVGEECEVSYCGKMFNECYVHFIGSKRAILSVGTAIEAVFSIHDLTFRPIITERQQKAIELYRIVNNDNLSDYEISALCNFELYVNLLDTLVKIQRGKL